MSVSAACQQRFIDYLVAAGVPTTPPPNPLLLAQWVADIKRAESDFLALSENQDCKVQVDLANTINQFLPLIIAGGVALGAAGLVAVAAKAYSHKRVITEVWTDKSAPTDFERDRKAFSDWRTGFKQWVLRHQPDLTKILGIVISGGVVAGVAGAALTQQQDSGNGEPFIPGDVTDWEQWCKANPLLATKVDACKPYLQDRFGLQGGVVNG